jgi:hypothetical protein
MKRKSFFMVARSLVVSLLPLVVVVSAGDAAPAPEAQARRFIEAVQKQNFKQVFDMTFYYQAELSQIKTNNPKALWEKLTAEYYESKKNGMMSQQAESLSAAWARLGGALFNTPTDPSTDIRALMGILIPSCAWRVSETRAQRQADQWTGRQRDISVVYVTVSYPSVGKSIIIGEQILKEAILSFDFDKASGLYLKSARVAKGDVYWRGAPNIEAEVAQQLLGAGQYEASIKRLQPQKGNLTELGKNTLALALFEKANRKACFGCYDSADYMVRWGRAPGVRWGSPMDSEIEEAIQIGPFIRERWIDSLIGRMKQNFNQWPGDKAGVEVALSAKKFASGFPELERKIQPFIHDLAKGFVDRARGRQGGTYFIENDLENALNLAPADQEITKLCVEAIEYLIDHARRAPGNSDSYVKELRQAGKSLGLPGF